MVNLNPETPSPEAPTIITKPPPFIPDDYFDTKPQAMFSRSYKRLKKT